MTIEDMLKKYATYFREDFYIEFTDDLIDLEARAYNKGMEQSNRDRDEAWTEAAAKRNRVVAETNSAWELDVQRAKEEYRS